MKLIFAALVLLSVTATANKHNHKHRHHKAHQHGVGSISIAFEGTSGQIAIEAPGEAIFGFEHKATKDADKKKQDEGVKKLVADISKMIVFPEKSKCKIENKMVEVTPEGQHTDLKAEYDVKCEKDLTDSAITFNIQESFPRFKQAQVQIIVGEIQKSVKAVKNGTQVELKK